MAIIQVSEKEIRQKYLTLDHFLDQKLIHLESDLFYRDGLVYKIFNPMYRLNRQSYLWILDENNFEYCLNIENQLYQGDKLIGCTTIFDQNYQSFKTLLENKNTLELYEANQILAIMLSVLKNFLEYNLAYMDSTIENIGLSAGNVLFVDIDGAWYKPYKSYIKASYLNIYLLYFSLLLGSKFLNVYNKDYKNTLLNILKISDYSLETMQSLVENLTTNQLDTIKDDYNRYIKTI